MVNPLHTSSCRCGDRTRSPRSHSYLCSGTHSLVAFLQLELFWGYILYYWVLVVVVVVVPVLEPSPPPVAASATPTAELTVLTLVAEELPAETDVAADPAASPTCTGAAHAEVAASADMAKCHTELFITISLH